MIRLGALAAMSMLLLSGCWPECDQGGYDVDSTLSIREDDPIEAGAIAECFDNDFACERLCVDLLGPPPAGKIRSIVECYANRDGAGGLTIQVRSHLVDKCDDGWGWGDDGDDTTWVPDAARYPDAWRDFDAAPVVDASPPDAAP